MIANERAVVDTGPLVAIVRKYEQAHLACTDALTRLRAPLLTCWPVLTEAAWILRDELAGLKAIEGLVREGTILIDDLDEEALHWIVAFMARYASIGAQMADAALMWIAEKEGIGTIFTLDRRDLSVYRTSDGRALRIVPEWS